MRPLILDYKTPRLEAENPITYQYDINRSLNVVDIGGLIKPFIDLKATDIELMTKTKIQRESDDDSFVAELGTKTEVKRERDDRHDMILELGSKTLVARERDDRHDGILEMMTKTRVQRERDDEYLVDNQ